MIADVMRNANTEHEIYFLLTAYVETARSGEHCEHLPPAATGLPLDDSADIRRRFGTLMRALDAASRNLDDCACLALREAMMSTAPRCTVSSNWNAGSACVSLPKRPAVRRPAVGPRKQNRTFPAARNSNSGPARQRAHLRYHRPCSAQTLPPKTTTNRNAPIFECH